MSPPSATLAPPKDDPITRDELSKYDGSDPSQPIWLAIKGTVFDVSGKKEMYGPGASYNVFAGKDGSVGLGEFAWWCVSHDYIDSQCFGAAHARKIITQPGRCCTRLFPIGPGGDEDA